MRRDIGCPRSEHVVSRRSLLAGAAAGTAIGLGSALRPANAAKLQSAGRQILQVCLRGGVSQLESWDPKPDSPYGGPFGTISTSVPGVHISELLPETARQAHRLAIVRSVNTKINDHGQGLLYMEKGRRAGDYPYVGSVAAKYLTPPEALLPGYIKIDPRGGGRDTAAFLGARYGQLRLSGSSVPGNLDRPQDLSEEAAARRQKLRLEINDRFAGPRRKARVDIYDTSFEQARRMMAQKSLFLAEPQARDLDRYGGYEFARHCILARTLLEAGVTCVKLVHQNYDTHAENFNFHLEQLDEFDHPFAMLLEDLAERGRLENTLVIVYSEFGRTPRINVRYGRDHWGTAWSVALGGCGIVPGAVVGKTNDQGTAVADREVDAGHLFHTYFAALGLDASADHDVPGKSIPIGDPAAEPIREILA